MFCYFIFLIEFFLLSLFPSLLLLLFCRVLNKSIVRYVPLAVSCRRFQPTTLNNANFFQVFISPLSSLALSIPSFPPFSLSPLPPLFSSPPCVFLSFDFQFLVFDCLFLFSFQFSVFSF